MKKTLIAVAALAATGAFAHVQDGDVARPARRQILVHRVPGGGDDPAYRLVKVA